MIISNKEMNERMKGFRWKTFFLAFIENLSKTEISKLLVGLLQYFIKEKIKTLPYTQSLSFIEANLFFSAQGGYPSSGSSLRPLFVWTGP